MTVKDERLLSVDLFRFFHTAFHTAIVENQQAINDLFQVILSNGFPRLRICTAARIGTFAFDETWTGSPTLRTLQLDVTTDASQLLLSMCPNLRRFASITMLRISSPTGNTIFFSSPFRKIPT